MAFFILTRFVLVKYSRAFVERPSQGTSSLASRLTTVSLDIYMYIYIYICAKQKHPRCKKARPSQKYQFALIQTFD